jgi:hypothetical protein
VIIELKKRPCKKKRALGDVPDTMGRGGDRDVDPEAPALHRLPRLFSFF